MPKKPTLDGVIDAYQVDVTVPNLDGAGTNSNVFFEIGGNIAQLDDPGRDDFERGQSYKFSVGIPPMTLSDLKSSSIRIFHDNRNADPGFYCGDVRLLVKFQDETIFRTYKTWPNIGWLALDEPPNRTEHVLQEAEELANL